MSASVGVDADRGVPDVGTVVAAEGPPYLAPTHVGTVLSRSGGNGAGT